MNDEQVVEAVVDALPDLPLPGAAYTQGFVKHLAAIEILAALRAAGFDVYRVEDSDLIVSRGPNDSFGFAAGRYRLVPVGVCDICGGTGWDGETIDGNSIDHGQPCACTVGG